MNTYTPGEKVILLRCIRGEYGEPDEYEEKGPAVILKTGGPPGWPGYVFVESPSFVGWHREDCIRRVVDGEAQ